uniref:Protein GAL3 n=1 Tax=Anthurium amnicola TaxID=1678845 RepID=A0A1D1YUP0_9ARAE
MGCSVSKLDDEEAVQLCKDRKNFIKQAVEQRTRFASGHIAYIQSLRRVSVALRNYIDGDEHPDFFSDSCSTPPFTPVKRLSPEIIGIPLKSFSTALDICHKDSHMVHYLRSGGNPAVSIEERPQSPETVRIDSFYAVDHYGIDGFFTMQPSPMSSSFFSSSPQNRPSYPPPSPQNSQWDFFWNPFSSLDAYGYPSQYSPDRIAIDDEMAGLRQIREEEGIPDLEEEEPVKPENVDERGKVDTNEIGEKTIDCPEELSHKSDTMHHVKECQSQGADTIEVSEVQTAVDLEVNNEQELTGNREATEETPGFTVYVNRRPTSMAEVIRDIEHQFMRIYDSAHEVSMMLEASRAQYSSNSNELTAVKMLNPVALFRSASFRSTSSRFLQSSSVAKDDGYETSSDLSEESCMIAGSHQSTLDRLYAWEKKLYEEVKSGERIRIAYEKKCKQLRIQDVNGEESSVVDKTRTAMRDLHTRIKVSIHSVEAISRRIETLRDEELHPQLMELIQGLGRMWRTMADCHHIQKRTIDEAKHLLATTPKLLVAPTPASLSRTAARLEAELRHWRSCLRAWVSAQRSYVRALAGWLLRCARRPEDDARIAARSPLSPPRSSGAPPVFGLCVQWSRVLDAVGEERALEGLDFFASGVYTVAGQQREAEEAAARRRVGEEEAEAVGGVTPEKMAEVAVRVLCAGMSFAVASLAEFAGGSRDAYEELLQRRCSGGGGGRETMAEV